MKLINELTYDFGITGPKVTASATRAVVENVKQVLLLCDNEVSIKTSRFTVSFRGKNFIISEIWEGRIELEGVIEGIEFYRTLDKDSN